MRGRDGELESVGNLSRNRWGITVGVTIPILNPASFAELSSLNHEKTALEEKEKYLKKELELAKENLVYKREELSKRLNIAAEIYHASERSLEEIPPNLLSLIEKQNMLEDHVHVLETYGKILIEIYVLDVYFEGEGGNK